MSNWNTKNNAGLRPALFFELTQIELNSTFEVINKMSNIFSNTQKIKTTFSEFVNTLIDEFFTPFIIRELNEQRSRLKGSNHKQKYASFFITDDQKWQQGALLIEDKYKEQLNNIKELVLAEIYAFNKFLYRLRKDFEDISNIFKLKKQKISNIKIVGSDRHNFNGSVIVLSLIHGRKFVYKPKSARHEKFLKIFLRIIFDKTESVIIPNILNKSSYSWEDFIEYSTFEKINDLKVLYHNLGILLAVLDVLNFSDGHAENFVVSNDRYFVPVDLETICTNLSYFRTKIKTFFLLEFTGMIPSIDKTVVYQPLVREKNTLSYFPFMPYIEHDNTDLISFQYRQLIANDADKSFPSKHKIRLANFAAEVINGLVFGYKQIEKHHSEILLLLTQINFLSRQIVRPTLYYVWIIHRYLHPDDPAYKNFLQKSLKNLSSSIVSYEQKFLQYGNIPVFYNKLHSTHLYDAFGKIVEKNYFDRTSYFWIKEKLNSLKSEEFIEQRKKEVLNVFCNG